MNAYATPIDHDEADLTQAIEAPTRLVDMDTGELHTGTALAPAAVDGEWISREARIQTLESMAKSARDQYVRANLELGQILREHRDLTRDNGARFDLLCAGVGLTSRHAYQLITVASAVAQIPSLETMANANWTKALTLIQGTTDDQIAQIASGQGDLALDEIDRMSVRKLKTRLRELTHDSDSLIKRATNALRKERDDLIKERDQALAVIDPSWKALEKESKTLRRAALEVVESVRRMLGIVQNVEGDSPVARMEMEQAITGSSTLLADLWDAYQERKTQDWPADDDR
jgi:hypothetical protein